MMKKLSLAIIIALSVVIPVVFVSAQELGLNYVEPLGLQDGGGRDARELLVDIVRYFLTFVAIVAVGFLIYGGFLWMTSAGSEERVRKAKRTIISAVIGLIVVISAYAIVTLVIGFGTGLLTESCTDGDTRACNACDGPGTQFCAGSRWQSCSTACAPGDRCCSWGCAASCAVPPVFEVQSTVPADGAVNMPRNVRIKFDFSLRVQGSTVDDTTFTVTAPSGPVAGSRTAGGDKVSFTADPALNPCPANPCGALSCLAANETFTVTAANGAGGILSVGDIELSCGMGPCSITFTTGDLVDCQAPDVALDFNQVCAAPNNELYADADDDNGVDRVDFFIGPVFLDTAVNPAADAVFHMRAEGFPPVIFDGSAYAPGTRLAIAAEAFDIAGNTRRDTRSATLRPAHCCDGAMNNGETGVDCGGPCAACDGAACGVSLNDDCAADLAPGACRSNDDVCASRYCDCVAAGTACQTEKYAAGVNDCCLCQSPPTIDWVSPEDGAPGNLVTVGGRNFGAYDAGQSRVFFDAVPANLASAVNAECADSWQDSRIVVVQPAGVSGNPVIRVRAANGYEDTTGPDGRGPEIVFTVNAVARPGLCRLDPDQGAPETPVTYHGINLGGPTTVAYFGNLTANVMALNSAFINNLTGTAQVPSLRSGNTTSYVLNSGGVHSNFLPFRALAAPTLGPAILRFEPLMGRAGQYVTVYGRGFGAAKGNSRVYFGGTEADYGFPRVCQGEVWSDNQAVVKVPAGLSPDPGDFLLSMTVGSETFDSSAVPVSAGYSSPTFRFDSTLPLAPSLCRLQPIHGPNNSPLSLWGEYFGATAGTVRFHPAPGADQSGADILFWGNDGDAMRVDTTIDPSALTGPVRVVQGALAGNGKNLTVGLCTDAPDPDAACGGGQVCCAAGTFMAGRCATAPEDCYSGIFNSVYEWDFSTADAGYAGPDEPCSNTTTCLTADPPCGPGLVCDPAAPVPCTCQYDSDAADSCLGRSLRTGTCNPYNCPNSPGTCNPYQGGLLQDLTGSSCDRSCAGTADCGFGGSDCSYLEAIDKCVHSTKRCSKSTFDIFGNAVVAQCKTDANGNDRWHFRSSASCPAGWERAPGSECKQIGENCDICGLGTSCLDYDRDGNGECVSNELCAGAAVCNTANQCQAMDQGTCECCCDKDNNLGDGTNPADCCVPLRCDHDCGADRFERATTGSVADPRWGYCSGCANSPDPDLACNCSGHAGKYCEVSPEYPDGVCLDCSALDAAQCGAHPAACCLDAKAGDACRGGAAITSGTDAGYCAYYNCDAAAPAVCAEADPLRDGRFSDIATCAGVCAAEFGEDGGRSCYNILAGNCSKPCVIGYTCLGESGCGGTACAANDDSCRCCCSPGAGDTCPAINPNLVCEPDKGACTGAARGLCCGCTADSDCADPAETTGCGLDACCYPRPAVTATDPADNSDNICRNAAIRATFDMAMDPAGFSGNVVVFGDYGTDPCPAGTQYLAAAGFSRPSVLARLVDQAKRALGRALALFRANGPAVAYLAPDPGRNYCAVPGSVSSVNEASGSATMTFAPTRLLDPGLTHYLLIKGDAGLNGQSGAKNIWGVAMNGSHDESFNGVAYANAHIVSFRTLGEQAPNNGVCEVAGVRVSPVSYLFQTNQDDKDEVDADPGHETFDTIRDRDKVFSSTALSADGQPLSPISGVYDWDWTWTLDPATNVVRVSTEPSGWTGNQDRQLIETVDGVVDGRARVIARAQSNNTSGYPPFDLSGTAQVYVFICQNPWPAPDSAGLWEPWRDEVGNCTIANAGCPNTNFEIYYCRDAGKQGTQDDLPPIVGPANRVVIGTDNTRGFLKEAFFPREAAPAASPGALSVLDTGQGGRVTAAWLGTAGVSGYRLYWGQASGNYQDFASVRTDGTSDHDQASCTVSGLSFSCTVSGLLNDRIYYFNLTSYFDNGAESEYYNEVSVRVTDTVMSGVPAINELAAGDRQMRIGWAPVPEASSYIVAYGVQAGGPYGFSRNIGADTQVILSGLTNGTRYYFTVRAVDEAGNESAPSGEAADMPFDKPVRLTGRELTEDSVALWWEYEGGQGVANTRVYYSTVRGEYAGAPVALAGPAVETIVTGLSPNTLYYFIVRSDNETADLSEATNEISVRTWASDPCGNGTCDFGECFSGCAADCGLAECCGREGCNPGMGENTTTCPGDCGGNNLPVPPPPVPPPPV